MRSSLRFAIAAGAIALLPLAPSALHAQAASPDSIAFPRQFVSWIFAAQGDSAFAHSGAMLRESMKSAEGVNQMSARVASRFGAMLTTDAEVQFDEGELKVYIVAMKFAQAPEPGAWVVAYSPKTKMVERASFGPLSNIKTKYPNAKLP